MKHSKIEWTTHTFNPWIGCSKVSPGCAHCYAEALNKRMGWVDWWGDSQRKKTSDSNWKQPIAWNRAAEKAGKRERVFCASLSDWLDHQAPTAWRVDLLSIIEATPNLDWLLLTKRPESWNARMHEAMGAGSKLAQAWLNGNAPENVWFGTSIEDQQRADERIPEVVEIPARIKFLSVEPMLGPVDLSYWLTSCLVPNVQWVIVGGESGPGARPMKPEWVRDLLEECTMANVPFFFKQWGGVRKNEAGRTFDGKTFDQFPA